MDGANGMALRQIKTGFNPLDVMSLGTSFGFPAESSSPKEQGARLCPTRLAFNVFSRPALLSGIGTQPSHDGVQ